MKVAHEPSQHASPRRHLTSLEREVITVAQLRAAENITRLARLCKRPVHQVRYVLSKLSEEGIIRPLISLNLHTLGWVYGSVHFTTSSSRPLRPQDVVKRLHRTRQVTYVSCFSTEPQYEVSYAVSSIHHVQQFIDELSNILPVAEKHVAIRTEGALSGRKYLTTNAEPGKPIYSRSSEQLATIDDIDRKLLHLLINEPALSQARIAGLAALPETTTRLRIRKLEEIGVIAGYRYHFQNDRVPILDFKVLVYTAASSSKFRKQFELFADAHKHVVYRSTCIGPWEFELDVEVESPYEAATLCHEIRGKFPNEVTRIQTLPRFYSQSFLNRIFA